jgi:[NiFe] hydrogenase diaphorase moiety large subunit
MTGTQTAFVKKVCARYGNDRGRMMDIVRDVQAELGCVAGDALEAIAKAVSCQRVEVEGVVTFYSFLSESPKGKVVIRLCDDIVDEMAGAEKVARAFAEELGVAVGGTTADGRITLEHTPCLGLCDQAPAVLINDVPVTQLDGEKARDIARQIKQAGSEARLVRTLGDGNNAHDLVRSMVVNNIRRRGPVVFADFQSGAALRKALAMTPAEVIRDLKTSRLRGRGGAGFPTGMKWDFTRQAAGEQRFVIGNADEGEPGTFKDRVLLTECPDLMFEGMTIAGYAIGADTGILYLRGEYAYLRRFLESVLERRRSQGLLGKSVAGKIGFNYDIRLVMGAGAYICGEETALISSCEGLRGDPKNRPPFPAQKGYLASPTTVNNVETFCCVARILDQGPGWFAQLGSKGSTGTKVLSVSGDCARPGVYEVPFGLTVKEMLAMVGAEDAAAVQIGGPSGQMVGPESFGKTICYDDLATGGAVVVFGPERDLLRIASRYMDFFIEESCGYCTPCRVGNVLLKSKLDDIRAGRAEPSDLPYLQELGQCMKTTSRCGLGQTSANPVMSTLKNFRKLYESHMGGKRGKGQEGLLAAFDIRSALATAESLTGRKSEIYN